MIAEAFKEIRHTIPTKPGVYRYYDEGGNILYVGKAKHLRKRVSSYFNKIKGQGAKLRVLVRKIHRIETTIVESETDALFLENALIKENKPPYNIQLKDDKSYPFICIKKERFPRVFLTRKLIRDGSEYLGPYTSVKKVRGVLEFIRSIYQLRNCKLNLSQKNIEKGKYKVCLEYHLKNCKGPCENLQNEKDYNLQVQHIRKILKGQISEVVSHYKSTMIRLADEMKFEEAHQMKKNLDHLLNYQSRSTIVNPKISQVDVFAFADSPKEAFVNFFRISNGSIVQTQMLAIKKKLNEEKEELLTYAIHELRNRFQSDSKEIYVPFHIDYPDENLKISIPQIGDKKKLIKLCRWNAEHYRDQQLKEQLKQKEKKSSNRILETIQQDFRLTELPVHIECFDNSNLQGTNPTASCVVFKNGKPANKEYRNFNIKTVVGPDDFASMKEVVYRRYKRLLGEKKSLPQLIVIDGGKGQLSSARESLIDLGIESKVAICGIAKRLEEIYFPDDPLPLLINKKSESLKVIQQLRNEAHRFAINHHRGKRSKASLKTELDDIKGIGPKTRDALLRAFKSVANIKKAAKKDVEALIGKQKTKALFQSFKK